MVGLAANYINASGRHLPDVPVDDRSRTVREVTGWPMTEARPGQPDTTEDAASTAA